MRALDSLMRHGLRVRHTLGRAVPRMLSSAAAANGQTGRRRVVVTGMGAVHALGNDVSTIWTKMVEGQSGIFWDPEHPNYAISRVHFGRGEGEFDLDSAVPDPDSVHSELARFSYASAHQALANARWVPPTDEAEQEMVGINWVTCAPNVLTLAEREQHRNYHPTDLFHVLPNAFMMQVAADAGMRGPLVVSQFACASGTVVLKHAADWIRNGHANAVLTGACDHWPQFMVVPESMALLGAISPHAQGDDPKRSLKPFAADRQGTVLGDASVSMMLEDYEHAKARGAPILAEVMGASHFNSWRKASPEARIIQRSMQAALGDASMTPKQIDMVSGHGTATMAGDREELLAMHSVFPDSHEVMAHGTKGATAHVTAQSGMLEAIFCVKMIETGEIPPTLNLENPDPLIGHIDFVPLEAKHKRVDACLSNSAGFGGATSSVVLARCEA